MRVVVTQADIDAGRQGSHDQCPVARAIGRTGWAASVAGTHVMMWRPDGSAQVLYDVELPRLAELFVQHFDAFGRKNVAPIEFNLPIEHRIQKAA